MNTTFHLDAKLVAGAAAALLLMACGRDDGQTAGQKVDSTVAKVEQQAETAKANTEAAAGKMGDKIESATDKVAAKVEDASITASVNAELAKDPSLSALKINVDTTSGRVLLRGTAPDSAAKERATQLASAVKGVTGVDNQLEVRG